MIYSIHTPTIIFQIKIYQFLPKFLCAPVNQLIRSPVRIEGSIRLGCDAASLGYRIPTFRGNLVSLSSRRDVSYRNVKSSMIADDNITRDLLTFC